MPFHITPVGITATVLGLSGIGYGILLYGKGASGPNLSGVRTFILSSPVDRFWERTWRQGLQPVSRAIGWTDRYVVDGAVNLFGWGALVGSEWLRRLQTGRAQDYVLAVVIGLLFFVLYGTVGA